MHAIQGSPGPTLDGQTSDVSSLSFACKHLCLHEAHHLISHRQCRARAHSSTHVHMKHMFEFPSTSAAPCYCCCSQPGTQRTDGGRLEVCASVDLHCGSSPPGTCRSPLLTSLLPPQNGCAAAAAAAAAVASIPRGSQNHHNLFACMAAPDAHHPQEYLTLLPLSLCTLCPHSHHLHHHDHTHPSSDPHCQQQH
eukprot:11089-Pelagomonas_calceolata.AAC.9